MASSATPDTPATPQAVPLCVDLDGTLISTDLLHESLFALVGDHPLRALSVPGWLKEGKAALKHRIAQEVDLDAATLPYRAEVVDWLREQKAAGRTLVLATASHEKYAQAVADHLGLFDQVIGSDAIHNRRSASKIQAIQERVGDVFDYAGDSDADLPLVEACRKIVLVEPTSALAAAAKKAGKIERVFEGRGRDMSGNARPSRGRAMLKLMRPHQWAKNALLFVPLVVGHRLGEPALLFAAFLGFLAFSAAASSVYIVNDLVDIESDRQHPRKRKRPLAAGNVKIPVAVVATGALLVAATALALAAGGLVFLAWLAAYLALTTAYSFVLKRRLLVDVLVLAWLYTHRMMAGGVAVDIDLSPWLIAFSSFVFLSLAFVKRYTELKRVSAENQNTNARRGYRTDDLPLIGNVGPSAGMAATLVLALYIQSDVAQELYDRPEALWALLPLFLVWILRVWFLAYRGELNEDPIAFAISDKGSYLCLLAVALVMLLAA